MRIIISKLIILVVTFWVLGLQNVSAQLMYVFDDERIPEEVRLYDSLTHSNHKIDTAQAVGEIISCINKLSQSDNVSVVGSLSRLFYLSRSFGYASGMTRCLQRIEFIAAKTGDPGVYLQTKILSAQMAWDRKDIKAVFAEYSDAEKFLDERHRYDELCILYLNMGVSFGTYGDYKICIKYILKAVYIVDDIIRNPKLHSEAYYRAALVYMETNDFENAKIYTYYALQICEREGFSELEAKCHLVMGDYYRKTSPRQYSLSYCEYDKVIEIINNLNIDNEYFLAKAYNGMGITLCHQVNPDEGIPYMRKALAIRKRLGNLVDLAESYMTLGDYYKSAKLTDSAEYYYTEAFRAARTRHYPKLIVPSAKELATIFAHKKMWENSAKYESIAFLNYTILNEAQNNKYITSSELDNTLMRERRQNAVLLHQGRVVMYLAYGIAFVMLCSAVVVTVLFIKKRRRNRQLREQKEELNQQKEVLAKQNAELEKLSLVARQTDNSIFLTDPEGNIIWLNEAFTRHSGYDINDYLNKNDSSIIKASSNTQIREVMDTIRHTKEPVTYSSKTRNKRGDEIWIQTTLSPSLNSKGEIEMFIAVCSDITDLKHAQERIAVQNKEINESLEYARKIQDAIQAPKMFVDYVLGDYFVVNFPKNIVSGDFHWVAYKDNKTLFSLADCTGHGIPGGFMSMIEQVMLNNVLQDVDVITSANILNKLRERNIKLLHQRGRTLDSQDGMDASLFVFDREKMVLNYAAGYSIAYLLRFGTPDDDTIRRAAQYSCPIIQNEEKTAYLIKLRPNRFPVGGHPKDHMPFTDIFFNVSDGDIVYTSSDGYVDQFGGPVGKKYNTPAFERTIFQVCHLPLSEQQKIFTDNFLKWRGDNEQTDDVHVFATMLKNNF